MSVYEGSFDEESFWDKLGGLFGKLGSRFVEKLLIAFEVAKDTKTPLWAKSQLVGALGYFGFPVDAVPDFVPFAGYSDDLAVLALALASVAAYIRPRHVRRARQRMRTWGMNIGDDDQL